MRQWLADMSISRKIVGITMLVSACSLIVLCTTLVIHDVKTMRQSRTRELAAVAQIVGDTCVGPLWFSDPEPANAVLRALENDPHFVRADVFDKDGNKFASHSRRRDLPPMSTTDLKRERAIYGPGTVTYIRPITFQKEVVGTVVMQSDLQSVGDQLRRYAVTVTLVLLASMLVAFFLGSRLQHLISDPILRLAEAARKVALGNDFSVRVAHSGKDEIGFLIGRFNEMLADIEERDRQLQFHHQHLEDEVAARTAQAVRSKSELLSALRNAPYGIFSVTLDGYFLSANPAMVKLVGFRSEADLLASRAESLYEKPAEWTATVDGIASGESESIEGVWKRKNGELVTVQISGKLTLEPGGTARLDCIVQDLTQRRHLEAQLRQAHKIEALGALTGGIAHDFNNIIMIIAAYSAEMIERLPDGDPFRSRLEEIQKAGGRAAALVQKLLAFSRKQLLVPRLIDLNAELTEMAPMLRRLAGEDIEVKLAPAVGLSPVLADPTQIEQVLLNLTANARDAMPTGGTLTVEVRNIDVDAMFVRRHVGSTAGPCVLLSVTDTGCGMTPDVQAQIFDPFFTTKEVGKGTGLGLASVYGIVKQSGGYIDVTSSVGHGTRFDIYLPRTEGALPEPKRTMEPAREIKNAGVSVLLVEDEDPMRIAVRGYLETEGFMVVDAQNGSEALSLCDNRKERFDVVVTDVVMPGGISGRELGQRILERYPSTKIIFISGYNDELLAYHGIRSAEVNFLQKPFPLADLVKKIRTVL